MEIRKYKYRCRDAAESDFYYHVQSSSPALTASVSNANERFISLLLQYDSYNEINIPCMPCFVTRFLYVFFTLL